MNDPHIVALHYKISHAESVDYSKAKPLVHEKSGFKVLIESGGAKVEMITHHATEAAARAEVEPFLREWELDAALRNNPNEIVFSYDRAEVIDRKPSPGVAIYAQPATFRITGGEVRLCVGRANYPAPPKGIARDKSVDLMFERFCRFRAGKTALADAAYFCLTILERNAGGRQQAAERYAVASTVLSKLGQLASSKGGKDARKGSGAQADFSGEELRWLEETVRRLIRRAGLHPVSLTPA